MTVANFSYQNYICIVLKVLQADESLKKHYFPYDNNLYKQNILRHMYLLVICLTGPNCSSKINSWMSSVEFGKHRKSVEHREWLVND